MRVLLVALLGVGLAAFTYFYLERLGRRGAVPFAFRALAWTALGLLIVNPTYPAPGPHRRPLVLLDGSLSLTAAGGRWREARDSAARWGELRLFGDERTGQDTAPNRGRSLLAPALIAASAADRPVIVVTDGEIEDARDLPPDLLARTGVRLFPRARVADVAITRVSGPARLTSGDTLRLEVELEAAGGPPPDSVVVAVEAGQTRLGRRTVRFGGASAARIDLVASSSTLAPGDHLLAVRLVDHSDAEPRTDLRLHLLTVVPTPGVVLLAGPADWDSRFLYRTLKDVAQLPVRGYARLDGDRWRSLQNLTTVSLEQVRQAARRADLLILKGGVGALAEGSRARGILAWPSGETGEAPVPGDWYLSAGGASPLAGAFAGLPLDSFPPAIQLTQLRPPDGAWVALLAQEGRRGTQWPAVIGRSDGKLRRVTVLADGLWRWAFRAGSSEQSYRAWVAMTTSWLLGGADTAQGVARPLRAVVADGRPIVFEWIAPGPPKPVPIRWSDTTERTPDTLRFDGAGRAAAWLPPGEYRYRLGGGGAGTVAVERYSEEYLPRPVSLAARDARPIGAGARRSARDWLWLFGLCVLALAGEWGARRRAGLK